MQDEEKITGVVQLGSKIRTELIIFEQICQEYLIKYILNKVQSRKNNKCGQQNLFITNI